MFIENQIFVHDFVWAISETIDLISPDLHGHHKKVAYISRCIAQEMSLPNEEIQDIILAAMLHDIGAFSLEEWGMLLSAEANNLDLGRHAYLGYVLLKDFEPLAKAAELIKYHHELYSRKTQGVQIGSYIIHLADRLSLLIDNNAEILKQVPHMLETLRQRKHIYHPDSFAALERLSKMEYFWIELSSSMMPTNIFSRVNFSKELVDLETLRLFAKITAQIIDFRSRFTATHSSGVAAVAKEISSLSGFSERECKMIEIAGFLHDLGKLSVPNEILEKTGVLNMTEMNILRKHSYYTYVILSGIRGLEHIATWAAHHHERLDGNGYPFHIKGPDFSKLSRIMAVADVITAVTENRPYRIGMNRRKAEAVLRDMVNDNALDKNVVALARDSFLHINDVRIQAQQVALDDYQNFHNMLRAETNLAS